jgi:hypothetical protein
MLRRFFFTALVGLGALASRADALELVMVERQGCSYCVAWKETIGPAYPQTEMGRFAPLRMVDIKDTLGGDIQYKGRILFTPTFVLVSDGREIGRIEGHPGDHFFWGMLEKLLRESAGYNGQG